MIGKRLAAAAAFCVLAAAGAFAQQAAPVTPGPAAAGPQAPAAAPGAPPAAKSAQWPRLLPDKSQHLVECVDKDVTSDIRAQVI